MYALFAWVNARLLAPRLAPGRQSRVLASPLSSSLVSGPSMELWCHQCEGS